MKGLGGASLVIASLIAVAPELLARPPQARGTPPPQASCGPLEGQLLKCPRFRFTYRLPFGWVDRTTETDEASQPGSGEGGETAKPAVRAGARSEALLAAFERPPGAPGETINSAVVIATESLANYPEIKTAADYFGPISELAEQRGFTVQNEPYSFLVGRQRLVRGDFTKQKGKLTMWQSSLAMISQGQIVSFTFVGGSQDEIESLISNLSFHPALERNSRGAGSGSKP